VSDLLKRRWREVRFSRVPRDDYAVGLATEARALFQVDTPGRQFATELLNICGFQYAEVSLPRSWPSIEAMLTPCPDGSFTVGISRELVRLDARRLSPPLEFLIAHEIAHSFFYDRRRLPPHRLTGPSLAEEAFCDLFAQHLLLPNLELPPLPSLAWLQRVSGRAGVSLGTAAYAATTHIKGVAFLMAVLDNGMPSAAWIAGGTRTGLSDWILRLAQDGDWVAPTAGQAVFEDVLLEDTRGPRFLALRSTDGARLTHPMLQRQAVA